MSREQQEATKPTTTTTTTTTMFPWSSHPIELEGCGGPRFQMLVQARNRDNRLTSADVTTFCDVLPRVRPTGIQICAGNRDDWQEMSMSAWSMACETIASCSTKIESFGFSTPFCRRGYRETKLQTLFSAFAPSCNNNIKEVSITDGLYGYIETFQVMAKNMTQIENFVLKDVAYGTVVDLAWCEALAALIRSLPNLTTFQLWSVRFESIEHFHIIVDALKDSATLEDVQFYSLKSLPTVTTATISNDADSNYHNSDFGDDAANHPAFIEKRAVAAYCQGHNFAKPYTLSQQLEALLHVRSNGIYELSEIRKQPTTAATTTTTTTTDASDVLATVSDRIDFCYQFLRREIDPTTWAVDVSIRTAAITA